MHVVPGPSLFLLLALCCLSACGWQIRDRIGDNELEERIIYPGTLWCGHGNKASDPSQLGWLKHTDACCRTHDMCPDVMSAGESKHNLTNPASHTRLSCDCDDEFYTCLKNSGDTISAYFVGNMYFNLIDTKCYKLEHPVTGCGEKVEGRCLHYTVDESKPKVYQWFDLRKY
ncbi:phospholipase A2 [Apis florea]|uniref:phospholipase A2 n=1 Tax=Apis florea TaxID=7463 RepID=UPI00062977B3|nr:phospholipase A2 [Apis florea]